MSDNNEHDFSKSANEEIADGWRENKDENEENELNIEEINSKIERIANEAVIETQNIEKEIALVEEKLKIVDQKSPSEADFFIEENAQIFEDFAYAIAHLYTSTTTEIIRVLEDEKDRLEKSGASDCEVLISKINKTRKGLHEERRRVKKLRKSSLGIIERIGESKNNISGIEKPGGIIEEDKKNNITLENNAEKGKVESKEAVNYFENTNSEDDIYEMLASRDDWESKGGKPWESKILIDKVKALITNGKGNIPTIPGLRKAAEKFIKKENLSENKEAEVSNENYMNDMEEAANLSEYNTLNNIKKEDKSSDMVDDVYGINVSDSDVEESNNFAEESIENLSGERDIALNEEIIIENQNIKLSDEEINNLESQLGISSEYLRNIEGFTELSEGQQALVVNNLRQLALGRVQNEAVEKYKKNQAVEKHKKNQTVLRFLGKIWKGITKNYSIRKLERENLKNEKEKNSSIEDGNKLQKEMAEQLVQGIKKYGPEVIVREGRLEIQYAKFNGELNEEEQGVLDYFNNTATEFSNIPKNWKYDKGIIFSGNKGKYEEIENRYLESRRELENLFKNKFESEEKTLQEINNIEKNIEINQFLNTNPDVEKKLRNIKDGSVYVQALKDIIAERGGLMTVGFIARTSAVGLLGTVALPFAAIGTAAGIGGLRGAQRSSENLKEVDILKKRGIDTKEMLNGNEKYKKELEKLEKRQKIELDNKDYSKFENPDEEKKKDLARCEWEKAELKFTLKSLDKNIVNGEDLAEKIESMIFQVREAQSIDPDNEEGLVEKNDKINNLLSRIKLRIDFTEQKIKDGLVNYGDEKNEINNMYSLVESIREANILINENNVFVNKELESRLNKLLDFKDERIEKSRSDYVRKKAVKGALISAAFASAGALIRDYFSDGSLIKGAFGGRNAIPDNDTQATGVYDSEAESIASAPRAYAENALPDNDTQATGVYDSEAESIARAPLAYVDNIKISEQHEVLKGESVWKISKKLVSENKEFSSLSEGQKTHVIDKIKDILLRQADENGFLKEGQVLKFDEIKPDDINKAILEAKGISPEKIAQIESNNGTLREFMKNNPDAPRTAENYEAILKGEGLTGKEEALDNDKIEEILGNSETEGQGGYVPTEAAQSRVEIKTDNIYNKGSFWKDQTEEWASNKNLSAKDVIEGKYFYPDREGLKILDNSSLNNEAGETQYINNPANFLGNQLDQAELTNRRELTEYLQEAQGKIGKPEQGETVEHFLARYEDQAKVTSDKLDPVENVSAALSKEDSSSDLEKIISETKLERNFVEKFNESYSGVNNNTRIAMIEGRNMVDKDSIRESDFIDKMLGGGLSEHKDQIPDIEKVFVNSRENDMIFHFDDTDKKVIVVRDNGDMFISKNGEVIMNHNDPKVSDQNFKNALNSLFGDKNTEIPSVTEEEASIESLVQELKTPESFANSWGISLRDTDSMSLLNKVHGEPTEAGMKFPGGEINIKEIGVAYNDLEITVNPYNQDEILLSFSKNSDDENPLMYVVNKDGEPSIVK